ncbi:MAG: hypothetical protein GTN62_00550, partial [Gemmatimonadales bacterium]|nr:hypothetical protein [Gemmatimonadales bacterium]NIN09883.1 hypothetical protein [Gemmatimonadales bacterium]NIN48597.1 hypothetical protein [Gemmatimonadales bacterium]NIP06061.1 hypothetical protein [Gemmatimonadales bacterium]NIR01231.1 hypothetical protein [Gemmatimonadales bacterium]
WTPRTLVVYLGRGDTNSYPDRLKDSYGVYGKEVRDRMVKDMMQELKAEPHYFQRRRNLALRLLRMHGWKGAKELGLVPPGVSDRRPRDPEKMVMALAREIAYSEEKTLALEELVQEKTGAVKKIDEKRFKELDDIRQFERKEALAQEAVVTGDVRMLFALLGFNESALKEEIATRTGIKQDQRGRRVNG